MSDRPLTPGERTRHQAAAFLVWLDALPTEVGRGDPDKAEQMEEVIEELRAGRQQPGEQP